MKALLIASVLLITSFSSQAITGNTLYKEYQEYIKGSNGVVGVNELDAGSYMGYVNGALDILDSLNLVCVESSVTNGQIYDVIGKYLENNPATRNKYAESLVYLALAEAFPCKE
jgi:hypothetical protein